MKKNIFLVLFLQIMGWEKFFYSISVFKYFVIKPRERKISPLDRQKCKGD